MVSVQKTGFVLGMVVSVAFVIHGCGSGGGGGGGGGAPTPTASTASKAAAAASQAIVMTLGAATIGTDAGLSKPSLKTAPNVSDEATVRQVVKSFKASLGARTQTTLNKTTVINSGCTSGTGSIEINDNDTPEDPTDDTTISTYDDCTTTIGDFTTFLDGTSSSAFTDNGFEITYTNFTSRITDPSGTVESTQNGTVSFAGEDVPCNDTTSFLASGTFTINTTGITKADLDNNGSFEINGSFALSNLTTTIAEEHTEAPDCTLTKTTFTMNGGISSTDDLDATNNFSATFTGVTVIAAPETRNDVPGDTLALSGSITLSADCVDGTFTISTPTGEEPFIPEDASCPVDGKFLVTGGGSTSAVTYTSSGGVQIDEGNNGSVESSFESCEEAGFCT